ncbi:MAG: glycosyltransferase [Nanoarchaeota archaeon]
MISIVITSFKESKTIGRAIENFLNQDVLKKQKFEIIVSTPDKGTIDVVKKYQKKNKNIKLFQDPGKGKALAMNLLLPTLKGDILIFSDGDVFIQKNSLKYLLGSFKDKNVGCATGRPIPINSRGNIFGYWSHLLCDAGAHEARLKRWKKGKFIECSGYLFAFRNNIIKKFPLHVAEDLVIPLLFKEKGYKINYSPKAVVYVKYPNNFRDFIEQKKRTTKGHEALSQYIDSRKLQKTKSFKNELFEGYRAFFYPETLKEFLWTLLLFPAKFYIYMLVFYHTKIKQQHHKDGWRATKSTK